MAKIGNLFFDNNWIDAPIRPAKRSGAFMNRSAPSVHPYILLNYQGKVRDISTLAHELGHGIHQYLANQQGFLMAGPPLTLAETASVFGEMLTFQSLLRHEKDILQKRILLIEKVEDMLNTVVRQIAFYDFEKRCHDERKISELTVERLGQL